MISTKVIADSKHYQTGTRLTTFEIVAHRYILAEINTHKMLSKNSSSSRAVPIATNITNILNDTAIPFSWGKNQSGMVADADVDNFTAIRAEILWIKARDNAIKIAEEMSALGIHKQIVNRILEPFSYQKIIITGTEWDNFYWLRNHYQAQPEIRELARQMLVAMNESNPNVLSNGEYHLPYVSSYRDINSTLIYLDNDGSGNSMKLEDAIKVSASCTAQVSYRKTDDTLEKANKVFDMLNLFDNSDDVRRHSSPVEHIGFPFDYTSSDIEGLTHIDLDGHGWSANFKDWGQYRHLIPNESCKLNPDIIKK